MVYDFLEVLREFCAGRRLGSLSIGDMTEEGRQ